MTRNRKASSEVEEAAVESGICITIYSFVAIMIFHPTSTYTFASGNINDHIMLVVQALAYPLRARSWDPSEDVLQPAAIDANYSGLHLLLAQNIARHRNWRSKYLGVYIDS
jgi:hypothetical protein